jgi:serine protease Do
MKFLPIFLAAVLCAVPAFAEEAPRTKAEAVLSLAPVVKKASPAVVNIYTRAVVRGVDSPLMADPFFRQFFGDTLPGGLSRERVQSSLGSGVIVSHDGMVVTNSHVVEGAQQVTVALSDKREFEAEVLSSDARSDLAILRLKAHGEVFPTLELADSDSVQVGDLVLAIGNPFGVGQTVTMGIVSAVARSTAVKAGDVNYFIQTDAAINPGNSGGALVGADGKLIGIPSAIYSRDGGSIGIGFAVPSNLLRAVVESVGKEGKVLRGWTGVYTQTLTSEIAKSIGIDRPGGVIVKQLHPLSPAKEAGLKAGDVIRSINGKEIEDEEGFRFRLATAAIGDKLVLEGLRKGEKLTVAFEMKAAPENADKSEKTLTGRQPLEGARVANMSPAVAQELNLDDSEEGVIIVKVKQPSIASGLGVRPGDRVAAVNGKPVRNVKELEAALSTQQGWRITLMRGDTALTLMVGP